MNDAFSRQIAAPAQAALDVWTLVHDVLEDLLADAREIIGDHLRHDGFLAGAPIVGNEKASCEIATGRSSVRLDCRLTCTPASRDERILFAAFGPCSPIVRIYVWRRRGSARQLESILAADPASRRWIATNPAFGPRPLDDREALETYLWTLLADPP